MSSVRCIDCAQVRPTAFDPKNEVECRITGKLLQQRAAPGIVPGIARHRYCEHFTQMQRPDNRDSLGSFTFTIGEESIICKGVAVEYGKSVEEELQDWYTGLKESFKAEPIKAIFTDANGNVRRAVLKSIRHEAGKLKLSP